MRCPDPFRYLSIRADGGLYPCCTFYSKHLLLDKFRSGLSLESVWNSPRMTALRQSFRDKAPCKACLNCLLGATQQG
ncbi:Iron-sulfur cluster-binding domain protein [anaerobic digester metagenome]